MGGTETNQDKADIAVFIDGPRTPHHEMKDILSDFCRVRVFPLSEDLNGIVESTSCVVLDVDLASTETISKVRPISSLARDRELPVILVGNTSNRKQLDQNMKLAAECGATNFVTRPFDRKAILRILQPEAGKGGRQAAQTASAGVAAAKDVLSHVFESAWAGETIKFERVVANDHLIVQALRTAGVRSWLETVRRHHDRTYAHSLLVTGVAVAFAQRLGMRLADQRRITHGALMHDIGKAFVPLDILDKPGKLTDAEMREIKKHPVLGYEHLVAQGGFPDEVLDCVIHHHELLDGSGYPDGLRGAQIVDLVRIITIADIFSALIEQRAYKPSLPSERALEIMERMSGQLDGDLLREFRAVALAAD